MLDQEDLKWIAAGSTELNSIIQQISRYADLARQHKGEQSYLNLLGERAAFASRSAQALFDRITSRILEDTSAKAKRKVKFRVVPPPAATFSPPTSEMTTTSSGTGSGQAGAQNKTVASGIASAIRIKNPNGHRECLLLVEDEPEVAEVASEMLVSEGYRVMIAHDGFEALRIYQSTPEQIGLVILDFFLPVMDGDAVFDELRELNPNINVVLSSGFAEQSKISAMLARGLRGFIPKPYTLEKLLEQVRSTLDAARQPSRN